MAVQYAADFRTQSNTTGSQDACWMKTKHSSNRLAQQVPLLLFLRGLAASRLK